MKAAVFQVQLPPPPQQAGPAYPPQGAVHLPPPPAAYAPQPYASQAAQHSYAPPRPVAQQVSSDCCPAEALSTYQEILIIYDIFPLIIEWSTCSRLHQKGLARQACHHFGKVVTKRVIYLF